MHSMDSIVAEAIEKMKATEIATGYKNHALAKDENRVILADMLKVALSHIVEAFQNLLNAKDEKITELTTKINEMATQEPAPAPPPQTWARVVDGQPNKLTPLQLDQLNAHADEIRQRERRARNIIIRGIPAPVSNIADADPNSADKEEVSNILNSVLNTKAKVLRTRRLPNRTDGPIIVTLASTSDRIIVLKTARKLKDHTKYGNVYINPDETIAEQARSKALRLECKRLNGLDSDSHHFVRNGAITKVPSGK